MHPVGYPERTVTRTAASIQVLLTVCFALLYSSMTSYAGLAELFEDVIRATARVDEDASESVCTFAARRAAGATTAEAARLAFKSLKVAIKNGAYLARTDDEIQYLTITGNLICKWSLRDGVALAHFIASEAEHHPDEIFELLVESEVFLDPASFVPDLPSNVVVRYVSPDGSIARTLLAYINGKIERLVEWDNSRSLFIDMRDEGARVKFSDLQGRPFNTDDVKLLTLVDPKANRATTDALDSAAKENGIHNTVACAQDIESVIRASHGKLLLVVGHTEGPKFVVRAADGSQLYAVDFRRLESLARANDVTLISLGCRTGTGGLLTDVQSLNIAAQLNRALKAKTYSDFYIALGTPESPFVVTTEQIDGATRLVVRRLGERNRIEPEGVEAATTLFVGSGLSLTTRVLGLLSTGGEWIFYCICFILACGFWFSLDMSSLEPLKEAFSLVLSPIRLLRVLINRAGDKQRQTNKTGRAHE